MNIGVQIIAMPLPIKDNLAKQYQNLAIRVQTMTDVFAGKAKLTGTLSAEEKAFQKDLRAAARTMAETCDAYLRILQLAEEEKKEEEKL